MLAASAKPAPTPAPQAAAAPAARGPQATAAPEPTAAPAAKKIVIATDASFPPMEFVDDSKNIVGFDMDLIHASPRIRSSRSRSRIRPGTASSPAWKAARTTRSCPRSPSPTTARRPTTSPIRTSMRTRPSWCAMRPRSSPRKIWPARRSAPRSAPPGRSSWGQDPGRGPEAIRHGGPGHARPAQQEHRRRCSRYARGRQLRVAVRPVQGQAEDGQRISSRTSNTL